MNEFTNLYNSILSLYKYNKYTYKYIVLYIVREAQMRLNGSCTRFGRG